MNSTRKLGSGSPEGRAHEDWRGIEPGEAENCVEVDHQMDHQTLDCCVQCLQENGALVVGMHESASQSFTAADLVVLRLTRCRGTP